MTTTIKKKTKISRKKTCVSKTIKRKVKVKSKPLGGVKTTQWALNALLELQEQSKIYKQSLRKAKGKKDTKTIDVMEKLLRELDKDKQVYLKKLSVSK